MDKESSLKFVTTLVDCRAAKDAVPLAEALTLLGQGVIDMKRRQGKRKDGTPMRNILSQDGEADLLVPAMDESVQAALQEINIDLIKGPNISYRDSSIMR